MRCGSAHACVCLWREDLGVCDACVFVALELMFVVKLAMLAVSASMPGLRCLLGCPTAQTTFYSVPSDADPRIRRDAVCIVSLCYRVTSRTTTLLSSM